MNIPNFVAKWKSSTLTERASAQAWFSDLCRVLGFPTDSDTTGDTYTFELGATKTGGGNGWADVWMRGHFAWDFETNSIAIAAAAEELNEKRRAWLHLRPHPKKRDRVSINETINPQDRAEPYPSTHPT